MRQTSPQASLPHAAPPPAVLRHAAVALAALGLVMAAGAAQAGVRPDPTGDFLASYTGPHNADLDVTRFSVAYDPVAQAFTLGASFAGTIDPTLPGFYVIGVNTGAGAIHPFGGIGEPNVTFDKTVVVFKNGAATTGGHALTATVSGDSFSVVAPLAFLTPGLAGPLQYGFNLWPRTALPPAGNEVISDFAPQNALLTAVPEPSTWAVSLLGLAFVGGMLRRSRAMGRTAGVPA
jgi:hypothetical protein